MFIKDNSAWINIDMACEIFELKRSAYYLVIGALQKTLKSRGYPKGVIVHSDRGSQYASNEYKRVLMQLGCIGSMSKKVIVGIMLLLIAFLQL